MKNREEIMSAGIDIGTSTSKLIISQLSILNVAGISHVPRIEIVDKTVLYKSKVYRTPLKNETTIDMPKVEEIIQGEYKKAKISPEDIETGAVIITGEAATKNNASEMVHQLSNQAGEFLVATAGPHLESMIAAKGSGAYALSKGNSLVRANVDIGGGTANIAVFQNENLLGTCALHVGGRLIEFDNDVIKSISKPIQKLCNQNNISLNIGDEKSNPNISKVIDILVRQLYSTLKNGNQAKDVTLNVENLPDWQKSIDIVTFSGGVAECMYRKETSAEMENYNDIGLWLAGRIQKSNIFKEFKIQEPKETVRATVLGAGMQTTEISGATIQIEASQLPLKNIPIIKHDFENQFDLGIEALPRTFKQAEKIFDTQQTETNFALSLSQIPYVDFREIQKLADIIIKLMNERKKRELPIILITESDIAKVLGQSLIARGANQAIICIDQIKVSTGDYIDIGKKMQSEVVPVVVKTLTFHASE